MSECLTVSQLIEVLLKLDPDSLLTVSTCPEFAYVVTGVTVNESYSPNGKVTKCGSTSIDVKEL